MKLPKSLGQFPDSYLKTKSFFQPPIKHGALAGIPYSISNTTHDLSCSEQAIYFSCFQNQKLRTALFYYLHQMTIINNYNLNYTDKMHN